MLCRLETTTGYGLLEGYTMRGATLTSARSGGDVQRFCARHGTDGSRRLSDEEIRLEFARRRESSSRLTARSQLPKLRNLFSHVHQHMGDA
jgi:hypothetical protein